MDWWTQIKDVIIVIVAVLGVIGGIFGAIWAAIKWGLLRGWQKKLRVDVEVFEAITNPTVLLPKLYATENDDSPLADHNIKYQPRDSNQDLQGELKAVLNRSRYLLITAPTGYGKTREAGVLAQTLMLEGWRVLLIRNTGWLDVPKTLPAELNNNRSRILIFLDDLNGMFSIGERTESPRAGQIPLLREPSYHDRLLQVLDMFEGMCTKNEIRVIATARSEADQWEILNYNEKDKLWNRFERVEILEPTDITIVNLLDETTKQADLKANSDDFRAIANKSDGTYRNIILNLRRIDADDQIVTKDNFKDTLNGSWQDIYDYSIKKHAAIQYIYDAIDILRQIELSPFKFVVKQAALILWGGTGFQKLVRRVRIQLAMNYLTTETKTLRQSDGILRPSDGQIEAKPTKIDWRNHTTAIKQLIFEQMPEEISLIQAESLFYFGWQCIVIGSREDALKIWHIIPSDMLSKLFNKIFSPLLEKHRIPGFEKTIRHAFEQEPGPYTLHFFLGIMLEGLGRFTEAKDIYQQLINENPDDSYAYVRLGDVQRELNRYTEAEAAYRQAILKDPNYGNAYSRFGSLLRTIERYTEAEEVYRQALTKNLTNTDTALIYDRLGFVLWKLERYSEAEDFLRKAIDRDSQYTQAYTNLIYLLRFELSDRVQEALPLLYKLIEVNTEDFSSYMAIASINKHLGKDNFSGYIEKARIHIPADAWYNIACLESICNNVDLAFEYLKRAKNSEKFNPFWAWKDPDLQWIRNDPRFIEIVGPKPEKNSRKAS